VTGEGGRRRGGVSAAEAYRSTPLPDPATPWREVPYCVLDLETTGLDPRRDDIISYAAVPIDRGRIVLADVAQALVKPEVPIRRDSVPIHGIRPGDVADAPSLEAVLDAMLEAMCGRVLVVHVDWVERGFLGQALKLRGLRLREPVLDTSRLAAARLPGVPEPMSLTWLARRLGLPVYGQHEALGDAITTAQVFLALATQADRERRQTLATLTAIAAGRARRAGPLRWLGRR
jgi:DNA polymerase-3 subunit epsilon